MLTNLGRRSFLRGAGALVALPALEGLLGAQSAPRPVRLAVLYVPNGVNVPQWTVRGEGADYALSPTLKALEPLRDEFSVLSGLNHENATPGEDGAGDHSRGAAVFLTGVRVRKTGGADIRAGVSFDQVAAAAIGAKTRWPSLQLSTDGARSAGRCDSGYSCAYQYNLSWTSPALPLPAEHDPRPVFEKLFGAGPLAGDVADAAARRELQRSVLDFVREDAAALRGRLGVRDREKLDQYFSAVREVERRIERAEVPREGGAGPAPSGVPPTFREHVRLMMDLTALAFQADATRIVVFMLAHEGSNRAFPEIGVPEAHHQISHHQGDAAKLDKIAQIDRFYVEQLKYFLERMKGTADGDRSLLDRSLVLYGSGISEGNQHRHDNLPLILAGRGGGTLKPGRHVKFPDPTPLSNLFLALLDRMGVKADRFGDSTGTASGI
jgi:hypothetical protein